MDVQKVLFAKVPSMTTLLRHDMASFTRMCVTCGLGDSEQGLKDKTRTHAHTHTSEPRCLSSASHCWDQVRPLWRHGSSVARHAQGEASQATRLFKKLVALTVWSVSAVVPYWYRLQVHGRAAEVA